ncbi:MAG: hypothetical protein IT381_12115 [Deltaproteobacteria bacterium]|nr:hypothetical protein [Deltaproteobacteria bacterium]
MADVAACIAIAIAMVLYPGGTGEHPHLVGHAFWENVLCDLAQPIAFNGQPNDAARPFAQFGTALVFLAGGLTNLLAPVVIDDARAARLGRRFGVLGALAAVFLPAFPSELYPLMHSLVVLLAGPFTLTACVFWVGGLRRSRSAPMHLRWLSMGLAASTALAFFAWVGWFARMGIERSAGSDTAFPAMFVAPLQRVALIGFVIWIAEVGRIAFAVAPPLSQAAEVGESQPATRRRVGRGATRA